MLGMCLYGRVFVSCETVYTSGCVCVHGPGMHARTGVCVYLGFILEYVYVNVCIYGCVPCARRCVLCI